MSDQVRIVLLGGSGLIGSRLIELAVGRDDVRIVAVTRRELALPHGARMEVLLAEPAQWAAAISASKAQVLVSSLGTTWRKAGRDEAAFRAVDQDLTLACAAAAKQAGIARMIVVSSVGADAMSRNFYLRVKGETEDALRRLGLSRLDVLRPGLLRGARHNDPRTGERLAKIASPLTDLALHGSWRRYRSIRADAVARAIVTLAHERAPGKFVHEYDAIRRAALRA